MRKYLSKIRKILFKNRVGEALAILLSGLPWLSKRLAVPSHDYAFETFRMAKSRGSLLKLDISNEVDHFIYFKNRDSTFDFLLDEIKAAHTILDIGGNIGAFALFFENLNPSAIICSFEPHPYTFKRLRENLDINHSHIQAFNLGLGNKKGRIKMYEIDSHNIGMNKMFKEEQDYPSVLVDVDKLDDFWQDRSAVDFIKIDVEGFEYAVLNGARQLLHKYFPVMVIEIDDNNLRTNGSSAEEVIKLLYSIGYDYIMTSDKKSVVVPSGNFSNCHFDVIAKKTNSLQKS